MEHALPGVLFSSAQLVSRREGHKGLLVRYDDATTSEARAARLL